ncbi:MAG: CBS domain-containing protein [Nostocoides sp.]
MRARDLLEPTPVVRRDSDALEAAALLAAGDLKGLVVLDEADRPVAVIPGSQVLRCVIPGYVLEDPHLARVFTEDDADHLTQELSKRSVGDVLESMPDGYAARIGSAVVDPDATALEVLAVMARARVPLAAVADEGHFLGVVRMTRVLQQVLPDASVSQAEGTIEQTHDR